MSNSRHYTKLVQRYRDNQASAEELEVFFQLLSEGKIDQELEELMNEERQATPVRHEQPWYRQPWMRIAATVLLLLTAAVYFQQHSTRQAPEGPQPTVANPAPDIAPGGTKALLQLADGSVIELDSATNGTLARQDNAEIIKTGGTLRYNAIPAFSSTPIYNTVTTPRGGQYQLILADGSKVWLNAASSISFPTAFIEKERKVKITGEAYFEVAKNPNHPFIVSTGSSEVEVLGTHFNVNAYSDEASVNTTLLEGSVKVKMAQASKIIVPGQQAQSFANGEMRIANPNLNEVVAWKNGVFSFSRADIGTILRQLARWYNFSVKYEKPVSEDFYVKISRNTNLSNVLKILEATGGVHFKIEGQQLIVKP